MKPALLSALFAAASFCPLVCSKSLLAQGSLTPPGAPAPTMKSLDQVQPRTPISSLPYTISASGSYYLTKNLAAAGGTAGITVSADNVTIDLCGFALTSDGSGSVAGINVPSTQTNLCVRNGTVSGWHNDCIEAFNAYYSVFENLSLRGSTNSNGLKAGVSSTVKSCTATFNSSFGIGVNGGSTVLGCVCDSNGNGIDASRGSIVLDCTCSGSSGSGISTADSCTIVNCSAVYNTGGNIITGQSCTVAHCTVNSGGTGIQTSNNCLVENCTAAGCSGNGINSTSSTVRGCEVSYCTGAGILVTSNSMVVRNSLVGNNSSFSGTQGGVVATASGNHIEGNNFVSNNNAGLYISGGTGPHITGNLIIGNSFSGALYIIDTGNTVGPLVNKSSGGGTLDATTNSLANIAY
jgi:parallel beta-helix repeat protein